MIACSYMPVVSLFMQIKGYRRGKVKGRMKTGMAPKLLFLAGNCPINMQLLSIVSITAWKTTLLVSVCEQPFTLPTTVNLRYPS